MIFNDFFDHQHDDVEFYDFIFAECLKNYFLTASKSDQWHHFECVNGRELLFEEILKDPTIFLSINKLSIVSKAPFTHFFKIVCLLSLKCTFLTSFLRTFFLCVIS